MRRYIFKLYKITLLRGMNLTSPASVRMRVAFNDYIFTADEARVFYEERLGL